MFIQLNARGKHLSSGGYATRQAGGRAVRCQAQHKDVHSFGAAGHSRADSGTMRKVDIHVPTIAQPDDKIAIFLKLFSTDWALKKSSIRD